VKKEFKSSPKEMRAEIFRFAFLFTVALLIIGAFAGTFESGGLVAAVHVIISLVLGPIIAVVIIFNVRNITVAVSDDEVNFIRGGNVYLTFPFSQCDFTSYAVIHRVNGIPTGVTRNIRVMPLNGGKYRDCPCVNFSRDTYEHCIAYINSRSRKKNLSEEDLRQAREAVAGLEKEPLSLFVNKMFWINHRKKMLIILSVVFAVVGFAPLLMLLSGDVIPAAVITAIMIIVAVACEITIAVKPYLKTKKSPNKITVYPDRLIIDGVTFYFNAVSLIRMTPPSYTAYDSNFVRALRITDTGGEHVFLLGDGYDLTASPDKPKIFADYERLYTYLRVLLALQSDESGEIKFMAELI